MQKNWNRAAAKLHAKINPFVFDTSAHFEYITEKAFQENHETFSGVQTPPAPRSKTSDRGPATNLSKKLSQASSLKPPITSASSLRTLQVPSTGRTQDLHHPDAGPGRHATADKTIKPSEATLQVYLNPEGQETTYHFEYGTAESYGRSSPSADVGPGHEPTLGKHLQSPTCSRNTTYHFRTVASNSFGTVEGPDTTFTTLPTYLPQRKDSAPAYRRG